MTKHCYRLYIEKLLYKDSQSTTILFVGAYLIETGYVYVHKQDLIHFKSGFLFYFFFADKELLSYAFFRL